MPDWLSFEEAASLPVAALTATNGLRRCGVQEDTRLLVNGATGGVGHFAVQAAWGGIRHKRKMTSCNLRKRAEDFDERETFLQ